MVRSAAFRELGGFDERYAPAYYEDADLCFGLRSLGYRVVYQPRSVVVHFEGISSGTDVGHATKRFQRINHSKFFEKWSESLSLQPMNKPENVGNAARRRRGRTILAIDSYVPMHDKEAGSDRMFKILNILVNAGYYVFFLPDNYAALQPYTSELQRLGIEVLHHVDGGLSASEALDEILPILDFAWISRPELFEKYADTIRRNQATKIIYDTIDLHWVRKMREAELFGDTDPASWETLERQELSAARAADLTIAVSDPDRHVLVERGITNTALVPTIHSLRRINSMPFAERAGVLFIGGYNHAPNVDAVHWLCNEIMPLVWARDPNIRLTLLGSSPTPEVRKLASDRVSVPGYLKDVSPYFESSRVFVAPIRFGAGLKGKIGQSLEYGLPLATTAIGAEGFPLRSGQNCFIANTAQAFCDAILRLYREEETWNRYARRSHDVLRDFSTDAVALRIERILEDLGAVAGPVQR